MPVIDTTMDYSNQFKEKPDDPDFHKYDPSDYQRAVDGICFVICLVMLVVCCFSFFWYKAYKNLSQLTLIGIVILMWVWSSLVWGFFYFEPEFFFYNFLVMMDVSSFLSTYFYSVANVAVFLQWVQLYKVISNPQQASSIIFQNKVFKIECASVFLLSLFTVTCIYFRFWDIEDKEIRQDYKDGLQTTF